MLRNGCLFSLAAGTAAYAHRAVYLMDLGWNAPLEDYNRGQYAHLQLIYTVRMPAYHRGAACLIGDAGAVAQPFTGSGVFKGYNNVESLLEVFRDHDDPVAALEEWDQEQVRLADRLLALGDQMEQAFIWDSLDLTTADASSTEAWWHASVQFPDDFTYEASD